MTKGRALVYIAGGTLGLALIAGMVLAGERVVAESAGASVVVPPGYCNLTTDTTNNVPHTATINAGTYQADIGTTTFKIVCGDSGGFSVYAVGFANSELGNNKLLANINGTLVPSQDITTGTATSGNTSNWAMKLSPVAGTYAPTLENGYNNYSIIPTTYTKVATFNSITNVTNGSAFQATYASYIQPMQPAGSYNSKVKFTMVHPATEVPLQPVTTPAGKIGYVPNASGVVDTMGDQTASSNAEVMLWPSNFQRPGYGFAGWNTAYDYSGTTYGPMETITTGDLSQEGMTLYAVWVKYAGDMQNWQGCGSMTNGQITALKDTRDDNVYAVAKLADGNCWMIENLRLGGSATTALTTTNTAISSNLTLPASTDTFTTPAYTNIEMNAKNTLNPVANMTTPTNAEIYSYGNYYSYHAAIGTTTANNTNNNSATTSICPAGWHLPKGGNKNNESNNEFWNLIVTKLNNGTNPANYSSSTYPYYTGTAEAGPVDKLVRTYPNNFLYSGYVNGSSRNGRGSLGYVWSSTAVSSSDAYNLRYSSSYVYPGTNYSSKYNGFSVRCVADPPTLSTITTMQEMTSDICAATAEGTEKQLRDTRDNKTYWVAKLKDGKCWMTQNLDLDLSNSTALTSDTTDLTSYGSGGYTTANGYSQQTVNGKNVISWTPTRATINATNVTNNSISNWTNDNNTLYSVDPGNVYWNNSPFYTSTTNLFMNNDWGSNPVKFQRNTPFSTNGEHGHVGNYYNWSAAVASNSTSGYTSDTLSSPANNPQNSICPAGWRLPTITSASPTYTTAGSQDEFSRLANLYANYTGSASLSSENLEKAPLYLVRGGRVYSSQQVNAGYGGFYWSSTVYSSSHAYNLYFYSSGVYPQSYDSRHVGFSVRCVAR